MNTPRIMIAGCSSGSGKTTITCGILKALQILNKKTAAFKCGPDYIDPMFHGKVFGEKSRNLDLFMLGENTLKYLLYQNSLEKEISIIECVMGFYDGILNTSEYSASHISNITNTPAVLVVDCHGMSLSICAVIKGFIEFEPNNIKAVILNNLPTSIFPMCKLTIEEKLGIKVLGYLPKNKEYKLDSRHLGLVMPDEIEGVSDKLSTLGNATLQTIDFDALFEIARQAPALDFIQPVFPTERYNVNIAVARDKAFCFYYEDSLELLRKLGANIIEFSPKDDEKLPDDIDGLILGGGYPEIFSEQLSKNVTMINSVKLALIKQIPTIAECGGFIYLTNNFVGAIDSDVFMTDKLNRFGYMSLTANVDNLLLKAGESVNGHEFHYSDCTETGGCFTAQKANGTSYQCIFANENLFAGYPHIHMYSNIDMAKRFLERCLVQRRDRV